MKKINGLITALALGAGVASAQNLLPNPGFEDGGSSWALWTEGSVPGGSAAVTYPTTGGRQNSAYARFAVTTPSTENWHIQLQVPPGWEAANGATYDLTFWAKSDNSSSFHFAYQDGEQTNFAYRGGVDFSLTPDWTEYTLTYTSDVEGNAALRFNLFLGANVDVYGFDDFSLIETPASLRGGTAAARKGLQVRQGARHLALALDGMENVTAQLFDLQGNSLASAAGRADGSLLLANPGKSGTYFVRANAGTKSWVRKITIR